MPELMTTLVTDAKLNIDIKLESAEGPKTGDSDNAGFTFKMKGMEGNQRLSMNTSALETKIAAFKLISMISESMGTAFAPYSEAILPIVIENMNYMYSTVIRKHSMKTMNNVLLSIGEPQNISLFLNLFPLFTAAITKALEKEDLKEIKNLLKHFWLMTKTLNENNKNNKNYMNE